MVHDDYHTHDSLNPISWIIGLILGLLVLYILLNFGLPMWRSATTVPQINIPGKIDVNVNNPQGGAPAPAAK